MDLEAPVAATTTPADDVKPTTPQTGVNSPVPTDTEVEEKAYQDERGRQVVPMAAFLEQRNEAKGAKAKLAEVEEKAAKLEAWAQQWSPYLTALAARPDLLQQALGQTAPSAATTTQPETDPEAEAFAREFDLFTPAGTLDVARAQRALKAVDARVERRVAREVEPVRLATEEAKAATLRQQAYAYAQQSGYAPRQALDQVLSMIPANLQADPSVMNLALVLARGIGTGGTLPLTAPAAGPLTPISEPLVTEAPGRRAGVPTLSDLERKVAQARGISADRWRSLTDTNNPVLE